MRKWKRNVGPSRTKQSKLHQGVDDSPSQIRSGLKDETDEGRHWTFVGEGHALAHAGVRLPREVFERIELLSDGIETELMVADKPVAPAPGPWREMAALPRMGWQEFRERGIEARRRKRDERKLALAVILAGYGWDRPRGFYIQLLEKAGFRQVSRTTLSRDLSELEANAEE